MIFRVPLPYRECSQNGSHGGLYGSGKKRWSRPARVRNDYRLEVHQFLMVTMHQAKVGDGSKAVSTPQSVSLTFCTKGARAVERYAPRDEPNAVGSAKALFDAMKDVGLLVDDSAKWMRLEGTRIDRTRGPYVEIEVRDA